MSHGTALMLCVLVAVIAVGECGTRPRSQDGESGTCKYWCKDGVVHGYSSRSGRSGRSVNDDGIKYYCCDDNPIPQPRNRACPPERVACPQNQGTNAAPNECTRDADCRGTDMCCPDVCLRHRTCKASQSLGANRRTSG